MLESFGPAPLKVEIWEDKEPHLAYYKGQNKSSLPEGIEKRESNESIFQCEITGSRFRELSTRVKSLSFSGATIVQHLKRKT